MRRLLAMMIALALAAACAACAAAEGIAAREGGASYILIIDNSKSTSGRHSLGSATDPEGLRFDAARLVYENVLTSSAILGDEGDAAGEIGVIVFCGPENCVSYGPVSLGADRGTLDGEIGDYLNEAANEGRRDVYTDTSAALEAALAMLRGFDDPGEARVILLTDGVNDLTNRGDPFASQVNIDANARSVALVEDMRRAGASFYVVALTSPDGIKGTDAFMTFINQLAEAGGGERMPDGSFSNQLSTTDDALNSKLLQMLVKAETDTESVQAIIEYTPLEETFAVPYSGLTDATVNITFMPEDKALLGAVSLVSPVGERYDLWNSADGPTPVDDIGVVEDRSYIMLDIPAPQSGDWTVAVKSRATEQPVLINAVLRLNHDLRLLMDMRSVCQLGDTVEARVWFQRYNGSDYEDLLDSEIYEQSTASLMLYGPDSDLSAPDAAIEMARGEDGRYQAAFEADKLGVWTARVRVENEYLTDTLDYIAFEVAPALTPTPEPTQEPTAEPTPEQTPEPTIEPTQEPTPEPTAEPTPEPTAAPQPGIIERIDVSVDGLVRDADGAGYLRGGIDDVRVSWAVDGAAEAVTAALLRDGQPVLEDMTSGDAIPAELIEPGHEYTLRVSAMPENGALLGYGPTVAEERFSLAPAAGEIAGILIDVQPRVESDEAVYVDRAAGAVTVSWTVDGEAASATGTLLRVDAEDETVVRGGLNSGDAVERALLQDDATYRLLVSAMPVNGVLAGVGPVERALDFQLYPEARPIVGLVLEASDSTEKNGARRFEGDTARLTWHSESGEAERYILKVTDSKGGIVSADQLPGSANSCTLTFDRNDDYTAELTAVPRYADGDTPNATASLVVRPHIKNPILRLAEQYWYYLAAVLAGLLALAAVLLALRRGGRREKASYIEGTLHVRCDELEVDADLRFEKPAKGKGVGVKEGSYITAHPEFADKKDQPVYRLLTGVKLTMARADASGMVAGDRHRSIHQPKAPVIGLTVSQPTGAKETWYVGEYDPEPVSIVRRSMDGSCEFLFWGAVKPKSVDQPPVEPAEAEDGEGAPIPAAAVEPTAVEPARAETAEPEAAQVPAGAEETVPAAEQEFAWPEVPEPTGTEEEAEAAYTPVKWGEDSFDAALDSDDGTQGGAETYRPVKWGEDSYDAVLDSDEESQGEAETYRPVKWGEESFDAALGSDEESQGEAETYRPVKWGEDSYDVALDSVEESQGEAETYRPVKWGEDSYDAGEDEARGDAEAEPEAGKPDAASAYADFLASFNSDEDGDKEA